MPTNIPQSAWNVIYLAACALNQTIPDDSRIESMDLDAVYEMASRHALASACATALQSAGVSRPDFDEAWAIAVRRTALMDAERTALFHSMDEAGIWYMPLKGSVLKNYYPSLGMREMGDNDILFDETRSEDVRAILEAQGFKTIEYGLGAHDVYHKEPLFSIEMHRKLFSSTATSAMQDYYSNIDQLMIADGGDTSGYHFRDEDFYVYLIAHEYKHFKNAGTGLRSLLDTHVFLKATKDQLDWYYINHVTKRMEIDDFEADNRRLSMRLFSEEALSLEDERMLAYIIEAGLYGNPDLLVSNQVKREGRIGYLAHRAFPPYNTMAMRYPVLKRLPILLPALWAYRLGATIISKPKKMITLLDNALHKA